MKKWVSLLFVAVLMLCFHAGVSSAAAAKQPASAAKQTAAAPVPKLYLDGKVLEANAPPVMINSSVLVPIRTVAENLGYSVDFDAKKKLVTVKAGTTLILMTLNDPIATVNGKQVKLVEPPKLQTDTTLIPLRFVGETLGLQVLWDNPSKSVFLYTDTSTGEPGAEGNPGTGNGSGDGGTKPGDSGGAGGNDNPETGSEGNGTSNGNGTGNGDGTGGGNSSGSGDNGAGTGTGNGSGNENGSGGNGTGSGNGAGVGTGTGGTGEGNGTTPPLGDPAKLRQINYQPQAVILTYSGNLAPTVSKLTGPDRFVIDLPNAEFAESFSAGYSSGMLPDYTPVLTGIPSSGTIAEVPVGGHDVLTKVRFSKYSDNPKTVRVVLDLSQAWDYELSNDAAYGEIRIQLVKPAVKNGYTVVLDAGHGGSDPGAKSVSGKWEKEFTLSVVKKVQAILAGESKINLVMTRVEDTYPTLDDRVNAANSLQADLFLSVHGNSYKPEINGTETYYYRSDSLDFAKVLHKQVAAATGFKDNGVRIGNYKVIRETTMPAVLLEVGYLSNKSDEPAMYDEAFQNRVAAAIAASIKQYLNLL